MKVAVDFLILGHPRSGTGYMARLFTALGYPVGHERLAKHGISSWMFAAYSESVPYSFDGGTRSDIEPKYVFHVVRHPIDAIASMAYTVREAPAWDYIARYTLVQRAAPRLVRATQSVIAWNRLIQAHHPRPMVFQVESAIAGIYGFLSQQGYRLPPLSSAALPPTNENARSHPALDREQLLKELPPDLRAELHHHSQHYGYEL